MSFDSLLWLFFCYGLLGWVLETAYAALRQKKYVDRSVLFGPLCLSYGLTGAILTWGLSELRGSWFFLFLGCAVGATLVEWVAGHLLERATHTRWWDYSGSRFHLDGYICLTASALYHLLPPLLAVILVWVLVGLLAVDSVGTILTLMGIRGALPRVEAVNSRLATLSIRMGEWILRRTEGRIQRTYPQASFVRRKEKDRSNPFARGNSFYSIMLLFLVGGVCGDLAETIFCRLRLGWWMSRSSVVWGPFSIVWGLALAAATLMFYRYRDRSSSFFFVAGTLLGGLYEYLCSVFTELVFGTVFWDYSAIPFNLGGRINLLYCFFWGFAAVAWFKGLFPVLSKGMAKIPKKPGKIVVWLLLAFMTVNMGVSALALARYSARAAGQPAQQAWEVYMDEHYGDEVMKRIYPYAEMTN